MSTAIFDTLDTVAPVTPAKRTAFYLESQGESLFAWLHQSEQTPYSGHGVVICPPIGYEQIHAHRSLRHLADALAHAGFPVLRFDYHGTGDSAGIDEHADRLATWLANIRDAKSWMQEQLGCTQICLFGLRLGAALAVQVAAEHPVDSLVLWAPVLKGRLYVREMKALGLTAEVKPQPLPGAPDDIEAAGFVLTKQTADDLTKLDLLTFRPQCQHALIVARDDLAADTRLLDHWSALGIDTHQIAQPGYADMMAEPHFTKVPRQAIASIVDWLRSVIVGQDSNSVVAADRIGILSHSSAQIIESHVPIRERVLHISERPDLFGIDSEPEGGASERLPLIVMLNAGSAYRVGPSRLYVMLARQLAAQGFRCLRMDLCGLGDSVTTDAERENDAYAATAFRDVDFTLKYVQAHLGAKRIVLMGLCSGAYVAFQSAAQIANPALVESVLINPLTFFWKEGMTIETSATAQHARQHYYWRAALQPGKWRRLLTGQTQLGIFGAVRMLLERWRPRPQPVPQATNAKGPGQADAELSHPAVEDLPADLDRVANAGRQLSFFFSDSDPGHSILFSQAKHKAEQLRQAALLSVSFIQNADHTFSERVPRRAVVQAIAEHLAKRYR